MVKVKMLARHTGPTGKMEKGLEYLLPRSYAEELIAYGLAVPVIEPRQPGFAAIDIKPRGKGGRFAPRAGKK